MKCPLIDRFSYRGTNIYLLDNGEITLSAYPNLDADLSFYTVIAVVYPGVVDGRDVLLGGGVDKEAAAEDASGEAEFLIDQNI